MKRLLLSCVAASMLATVSSADMLGFEAGYAAWAPSLTGDIKNGGNKVDFEKDLGYGDSEANSFFWAYFDHPIPLLPNIKIQQTNYSDSATGTATLNTTFAGKNISSATTYDSELTLNQTDIIPYWRILDNWVNFDIGFNLKSIDGNIKIKQASVDQDFSAVIPLLYAKARFDMPFTGFSIEADMSYLNLAGNKISDMKAGLVYQSVFGLGATIGIRKENVTLDDIDDISGTLDINGVYAGLFYHF
jgi:outer membrane protein